MELILLATQSAHVYQGLAERVWLYGIESARHLVVHNRTRSDNGQKWEIPMTQFHLDTRIFIIIICYENSQIMEQAAQKGYGIS